MTAATPWVPSTPTALYRHAQGNAFDALAPVLQRFHGGQVITVRGTVTIRHSPHPLGKLLLWLMRTPKPCQSAPCTVQLLIQSQAERWLRTMNGQAMPSQQTLGGGAHLIESVFPYGIVLRSAVNGGDLWQCSAGGRILGVSIPLCLSMQVHAHERALTQNTFSFRVKLRLPLLGTLLAYSGRLRLGEL
jgi:hypothetical protein